MPGDHGGVLCVAVSGLWKVLVAPGLHIVDHIHKAPAQIGQGVFDPRRDFLKIMPDQETIRFQLPELLRQGGFRDFAELAAQCAKSVNITKRDIVEYLKLPFAAQYFFAALTLSYSVGLRSAFFSSAQPPVGNDFLFDRI